MAVDFVLAASVPVRGREGRPEPVVSDIVVDAPPELPHAAPRGRVLRLLPVAVSAAAVGVMAVAVRSGSTLATGPMFMAVPAMMVASAVMTALIGFGQRRHGDIAADRADYHDYLGRLRAQVRETAATQRLSLEWDHPDPESLWTLIGGPRMWERQLGDADFCQARVGTGTVPLATRLVAAETPPAERSDPVTVTAMHRFVDTHAAIADAPIAIELRGTATVTIDGDLSLVRGLLRAVICQLAVLHSPDQLLIAAAIGPRSAVHWDWLKWLPHNQHRKAADAVGPARMLYGNVTEAAAAIANTAPAQVLIIDDHEPGVRQRGGSPLVDGAVILEVRPAPSGPTIRRDGEVVALARADHLEAAWALTCARRLGGYRVAEAAARESTWQRLLGVDDIARLDPITLWRRQNHRDRLCVPIGTTAGGAPVELDIKEPAESGIGPHGLCVGATGSGKSELLRTVALGMMMRNSPEVLNLLLVDFKGGATFLDLGRAPHVAAVITNLADEAPLVARMRDALAGEMNRRQQLLRMARHVSVAAYGRARRAGALLTALPALFIIVDEFSELLSQHPDFADMFVAIGRLGRSLGMHLLLASQRLDEGRLRGLEAHLSYRICLKTLSAAESRTALGTLDAYELPNVPGVGFLRSASGELTRFTAAFVSGPLDAGRHAAVSEAESPSVRPFTARNSCSVTHTAGSPARTVSGTVLDRIAEHGPPAHQVWIPPLKAAPALDALLRDAGDLVVAIGIVDRPFEQRRTPLTVDLSAAAGNVAVVGAPQSGKSTALRTLITALAQTHDPGRVQFYCLDFGGGALSSLRGFPHIGAIAGRAEAPLARRIVAEMETVVRARENAFRRHNVDSIARYRQLRGERAAVRAGDPFGDVFLVIDGWGSLRHDLGELEEAVVALAVQGLSFGVHVVLSASRWAEIRPALRDQIGTRIELRLGDSAESEVDRKRAQQVPQDNPGRGLSREGLHMQIASPGLDATAGARAAEVLRRRHGELAAPAVRLLPSHVEHGSVVERAPDELRRRILLGIGERRLDTFAVDFEHESHLLVLGESRCGKTAVLRTLCREIVRTATAGQARMWVVDFRRTLLGVVESQHLGGYAVSPAALGALFPGMLDVLRERMPPADASQAQLRARSWWSGPDIFIVVDDYDLVTTASTPLAALLEYLPYARDLGLHVIVARRSGGAARGLLDPLIANLRDVGCMGLMMSGRPEEGVLLGGRCPTPLPPGRARVITRADEQMVQVAWSTPR